MSLLENDIFRKKNPTSLETQFLKAYQKTFDTSLRVGVKRDVEKEGFSSVAQKFAALLDKQWTDSNKKYRTTGRELPAHAIGETVGDARPNQGHEAPKHLNTTLTSDFMLVLDLARRVQEERNKNAR